MASTTTIQTGRQVLPAAWAKRNLKSHSIRNTAYLAAVVVVVVAVVALPLAGRVAEAFIALEAIAAVGVPIAMVVHRVAGQALHAFEAVTVVTLQFGRHSVKCQLLLLVLKR